MQYSIHFIIIILGSLLIWYLIIKDRTHWIGLPFVILIIEAMRDVGFGPIINDYFHSGVEVTWIGQASSSEMLYSIFLIMLCYACIYIGMLCVVKLWHSRNSNKVNNYLENTKYSNHELSKGWRISVLFFIVGLIANIAVVAYLLPGRSIFSLAFDRAVFTDSEALTMKSFYYLRTISSMMQYGAIGLLFFSMGKKLRISEALIANIIYIAFQALFGGRQRVIIGVLVMLLGYHYGVRRINIKDNLKFFVLGYIFLIFISYARFESETFLQAIIYPIKDILGSWRMDQAAFILRTFPERISFSGNINMLVSIMSFLPTIVISNNSNLWLLLVDKMWDGNNPHLGIGGENFPTSAELYSWGGYTSVVIFGILAGLFFGMIFEWQRRDKNNIFKNIFVILIWANIFSFESRLPAAIGSTVYLFVPISVMAALTIVSGYRNILLILLLFQIITLIAYQGFRDSGLVFWYFNFGYLKYLVIFSLPILYYFCWKTIQFSGPKKIIIN